MHIARSRFALVVTSLSLSLSLSLLAAACGPEGDAMKGSWQVARWSASFAANADCSDLEDKQAENAGTMVFDDVPHPDGIGDRTFTYALTTVFDTGNGAFVAADPTLEGSAGWSPDDEKEETEGIQVTDPDHPQMRGTWTILESALGAINVQHKFVERLTEGAATCTVSDYFLVSQ